MLGRMLVGCRDLQELPVVPRPAEQRDTDREFTAAEEARRHSDLRQAGEGASSHVPGSVP